MKKLALAALLLWPAAVFAQTTGGYAAKLSDYSVRLDGGSSTIAAGGMATDALWDAAGDLAYGTGADTGARLAAGTATQVLHSGATPSWSAVDLTNDVTGTLASGSFAANTVALSKLSNAAANSRILGSGTAGAGASYAEFPLQGLSFNLNPAGTQVLGFDPRTALIIYDDFPGVITTTSDPGGSLKWTASATSPGNFVKTGEANHPGIVQMTLGTTGTSVHIVRLDANAFVADTGTVIEWMIRIPNLSGGGNNYKIGCGAGDSTSDPTSNTDGLLFIYDQATSVNWRIVNRNNSTGATSTSSTAVSGAAWIRLTIWVENSTTVHYYVNGTELNVSPVSNNVPTARGWMPMCGFIQTAGTTLQMLDLDYFYMYVPVSR